MRLQATGTPMIARIRQMIPRPVKSYVRARLRDRCLRRAVKRLRALPSEQIATPAELAEFREAFGNIGFVGDCEFLAEAARRAARSKKTLLECGSGASTIVLALIAARQGARVISLEQDKGWFDRMTVDLARLRIDNVTLCLAPLRDYGDYEWYDDRRITIPDELGGVFCDGPFDARGYRVGLLPYLLGRQARFSEILCDDGDSRESPAMLRYWEERCGATSTLVVGAQGSLVVVRPAPVS